MPILKMKVPATLLTLLLLLTVDCSRREDWLFYRGQNGAGYTPNALYPPLGRRWILELQKKPQAAKYFNPPIVMDKTIYFGSGDKNFYALDLETGYMLWSFKTKAPVNSVPFADDKRVYFGSNDGKVYALDRITGKLLWAYDTEKTVQSLLLRYEDMIIFTSDQGATYFLDLNGKFKYKITNPYWRHHTFQIYEGVLYWAPRDRHFAAYDIKKRKFLWGEEVNVSGVWYSFPAVDEESVYYARSVYLKGGGVSFLYKARERLSGRELWTKHDRFQPGTNMARNRKTMFKRYVDRLDYLAPSLWRDLVVFTSGDIWVRALHKKTGKTVWKQKFDYPVSSAPTIGGDRVYFGLHGEEDVKGNPVPNGRKPRLVCISAHDGKLMWELDIEGVILSAPVISRNRLMFGTDRYLFYVLEEIF